MTILYISDSTIPSYSANSIHVMKMCSAWAAQGHRVTLLAKRTGAQVKPDTDVFGFYGVAPAFDLRIFPATSFPGSGRLYNAVIPFITGRKWDLVYTRAIWPAFWFSLLGKNIVFEIHEPFDTKSAMLKSLFSFIVRRRRIIKWVVISDALRQYLIGRFPIPPDSIVVAHDGADPFPADVNPAPTEGAFKVGYVGSLLKGKGMEILLPLSRLLPHVTFHVVGGSKAEIQSWKEREAAGSNVVFHGFQRPADTVRYIRSFDVLIAPYLSSVYVKTETTSNNIAQWMSPLKIFEYMSSGVPMITSNLPVLREVLVHGETALLCDPSNAGEWASAVSLLQNDRALGEKIATNAVTRFMEKYTWSKRAEFILQSIKG